MSRARQRLCRRVARRCGDESGFSMIELIMAIFIFGLVVTGIAAGMMSTLGLTRTNRNRSVAANLGSQEMDLVRSTNFTSLPLGQLITTQSVDGVIYTVDRESEWVTSSASSGPCQAPAGSTLAYMSVAVSVTWPNMAGVAAPASSTVVAPPVGTYDPNNGHIAVTVRDRNGAPQDGVAVTITGSTVSASQSTGVDGCAFFAFEPAGTYTVSLSNSGYVSDQGVTAPTQSATVQNGGIVQVQFQYDQAATMSVTLQGNTGGTIPATVPITLWNTHTAPAGLKTFAGSGNPRTISGLFPYVDGYDLFAGACLDSNPEGTDTLGALYYPGASRVGPVTTAPGTTATVTLPMAEVLVTTQTSGGILRSGVTVTATHAADSGCATGETFTLGTTGAAGTVLAALPYGTWSITAGSTSGGTMSLSPLNPPTPVTKTVIVP